MGASGELASAGGDDELWSGTGNNWQGKRVGKGLSDGPVI